MLQAMRFALFAVRIARTLISALGPAKIFAYPRRNYQTIKSLAIPNFSDSVYQAGGSRKPAFAR